MKLWLGWLGAALALPMGAAASGFECLIEASQTVEIRSSVDGIIASVNVQRGDVVRRGQALVELSSAAERLAVESARYRSVMEGQVSSARNRVDYATKKLARANELAQQNYGSMQARDEAEAERRLAESELQAAIESRELAKIDHKRAIEQLALRTMTSPFNGVVVDRMLNPGDLAESGSGRKPVLKVAQIDPLRVDIVLPAAVFGKVKPGMKASVQPVGVDARYAASVKLVDKLIDAASGTFVARLELPNPSHTVPGGVRCNATIDGISAAPRPKS
ncbi:MAG TPA: efflux RND transporter periplasmic adaptor subunit [Burkholderiaceae bacterium]|nr:efflux RND transporter periplasmic adaptor subunit [Burkholderiaceae bacterium]